MLGQYYQCGSRNGLLRRIPINEQIATTQEEHLRLPLKQRGFRNERAL